MFNTFICFWIIFFPNIFKAVGKTLTVLYYFTSGESSFICSEVIFESSSFCRNFFLSTSSSSHSHKRVEWHTLKISLRHFIDRFWKHSHKNKVYYNYAEKYLSYNNLNYWKYSLYFLMIFSTGSLDSRQYYFSTSVSLLHLSCWSYKITFFFITCKSNDSFVFFLCPTRKALYSLAYSFYSTWLLT